MDEKPSENVIELCEKIYELMNKYEGGAQATALSFISASMIACQSNIDESYFKFNNTLKKWIHEFKKCENE